MVGASDTLKRWSLAAAPPQATTHALPLLLPAVVSVTYEINRYMGGHDNFLTRICTAPGLWLQNWTTFEPDDSMIEVGIAALKAVIPEEKGKDRW